MSKRERRIRQLDITLRHNITLLSLLSLLHHYLFMRLLMNYHSNNCNLIDLNVLHKFYKNRLLPCYAIINITNVLNKKYQKFYTTRTLLVT